MSELQTVLEKFYFCQQKLEEDYSGDSLRSEYLINFAGIILSKCRKGFSFETYWEDFGGEFDIYFLNDKLLEKYSQNKITREDMEIYYNHTLENCARNCVLH